MPTSRETLGAFLTSEENGTAEKWIVKWQFRLLGDFETALAEAITKADEKNLGRLAEGFPMQVSAFISWQRGVMANRLRKAGLDV